MKAIDWTQGLNPEQKEAVLHSLGPQLILAGAGSGKTTVLISRAGRLISEGFTTPDRLCVLTFTNKAARELKSRVERKMGKLNPSINAGTFHSFGLQLLKKNYKKAGLNQHFGILSPSDAVAIVRELLGNFSLDGKNSFDADKIISMMGTWREKDQTQSMRDDEYETVTEWMLPKYLEKLKQLGMVDFDSLILKPVQMMESDPEFAKYIQNSFDYVMVDEFQDTNYMQMRLIQKLVEGHKNISVVGDDDQSIYGWRGACVSNILSFPKYYEGCKVVRLERNYRSTPEILNVANSLIRNNKNRHGKQLIAQSNHGDNNPKPEVFVFEDETEEVESVLNEINRLTETDYQRDEVAVLYRSNSQGAFLEAKLRESGVPYVMSGGTAFFDRKETRDILAFMRSAFRPTELSFRRILNVPSRGIGMKTLEQLNEYAEEHKLSFFQSAKRWQSVGVDPKAGRGIDSLLEIIRKLVPYILEEKSRSAGDCLIGFLTLIKYKEYVEKTSRDGFAASKKWRVVEIFGEVLNKFIEKGGRTEKTLEEFIDAMELRDPPDDDKSTEKKVQLLTLHACKGLEFPAVILMGIEEDILPHRTLGTDISEERRLFYVGITRAQKRLIMTRVEKRKRFGKVMDCPPSRFLLEIPEELMEFHTGPRPMRENQRKAMLDDLFAKLDKIDARETSA